MNTDLRKAAELRNDAIRCNNRLRFVIAELSAHIQKNRDLAEELKGRCLRRRLSAEMRETAETRILSECGPPAARAGALTSHI
jgi:hypothetical protein